MSAEALLSPDEICRGIYEETRQYAPITNLSEMGFEILLGPPFPQPPIVFIGYQPGEGTLSAAQSRLKGYEDHWITDACQLALEDWVLAKKLQRMFDRELLANCVGLNAIFVRAKNIGAYNSRVPIRVRREIQQFCLNRVERILDSISPKLILVIGLQTLELFGGGTTSVTGTNGRVLMKSGKVFNRKAHAMLHLSGCRIASGDREAINAAIHAELATSLTTPSQRDTKPK
jgi:hypothetical protein